MGILKHLKNIIGEFILELRKCLAEFGGETRLAPGLDSLSNTPRQVRSTAGNILRFSKGPVQFL
jgi:hypothetical protein